MKSFKAKAEAHQKKFVSDRKGSLEKYCILSHENAIEHQLVTWDGIIEEIEQRREVYKKDGSVKMPFRNMLRSEHVPYNFFVPLKLNTAKDQVLSFFERLFNRDDLVRITKFLIEWAPNEAEALGDRTSFDTYIQFELKNQRKLGVGIEVKYTEKSYPYTQTELLRMKTKDASSPYYDLWSNPKFSIYNENTYETLGQKQHKQFFRNHLLGLAMVRNKEIDEFVSLHLYPSANDYQNATAESYRNTIRTDKQECFKAITFETFIAKAKGLFSNSDEQRWLKYLVKRYLVK